MIYDVFIKKYFKQFETQYLTQRNVHKYAGAINIMSKARQLFKAKPKGPIRTSQSEVTKLKETELTLTQN